MGSAGDPGGFERGVEVVVDHLERRCETVVDADLLRGELVLEHLIFDAVEGQRAGGIEAEGLQIAGQNLHRSDPAILDRADEFAPRRERKILAAPQAQPLGISRSEEHTSELQSLMRISYAVFCWEKKKQ